MCFGAARILRDPETCAANSAAATEEIYRLLKGVDYDIRQIHPNGDEVRIKGFDLNDRTGYRG